MLSQPDCWEATRRLRCGERFQFDLSRANRGGAAMGIPGVPAEGLKTIGQIVPTNPTRFRVDQDAASIAVDLVKDHTTGAPVVDADGRIVGFISEIDVLEASRGGCDLRQLRAADIMT